MQNHGLVSELDQRLREGESLAIVSDWSDWWCCDCYATGRVESPERVVVSSRACQETYKRSETGTETADKNESCASCQYLLWHKVAMRW